MTKRVLPFVLLLATATGCLSPGGLRATSGVKTLRRSLDSLLLDSRYRHAHLGVLVVDAATGDTLLSHNAGKLFMPASNQKLLTGAVALEKLGPAYRFSTTVFADGQVKDGVLDGHLRIEGTGDPSMSDAMAGDAMRPLRAMADSLASRGIRHVRGSIVPGRDAFPDAVWGFGWSWDDMDFPYSAGVDELYLNEGFATVLVRGGKTAGSPVMVQSAPATGWPLVRTELVTAPAGTRSGVRLLRDSADANAIIVTGAVAPGDSARASISWPDQSRAWLEAFRTALRERGIMVDGGIGPRRVSGISGFEPSGIPLFSLVSPPLSEILPAFEKPSQNQIGEILLKSIGRTVTGVGSADSGSRAVQTQLAAWGASTSGALVRDGSGLSRYNVVSPETIIRVLDAMRRSPHFEVFHRSLPVAGVDGTIRGRMRGTSAEGNVHAKTGTLNMVRALSGYTRTADGRLLMFSLLANHFTVPTREIDALHEHLVVQLTQLRGGR